MATSKKSASKKAATKTAVPAKPVNKENENKKPIPPNAQPPADNKVKTTGLTYSAVQAQLHKGKKVQMKGWDDQYIVVENNNIYKQVNETRKDLYTPSNEELVSAEWQIV